MRSARAMLTACDPEVAKKLLKELDDAEAAASKVGTGDRWRAAHPVAHAIAVAWAARPCS